MNKKYLLAILIVTSAAAAQGVPPAPSQKNLEPAVKRYLREDGNFCLGKFDWPITVTGTDRESKTSNAVQMPVLEQLGLVTASSVADDPTAKSYDLTRKGRKYYLVKKTIVLGPLDHPIHHQGDFCVAKLKLDQVTGWQPVSVVDGRPQTTVKYTYRIASVAEWTHDPRIKQVFPMIDHIVAGEGKLQLMQAFAWDHQAWVAVTPGE